MKGQVVGAVVFGIIFIALLFYMYLEGGQVTALQYNIASVFAALCAGLLAYFITGSLDLSGKLPPELGGLKAKATSGGAVFLLVLLLFWANRPPGTVPVSGYVYEGTREKPGKPAAGATVHVIGAQVPPVTTGKLGDFSFADVRVPRPEFAFEYHGSPLTTAVPVSSDGKYYLNLPPPPTWQRLSREAYEMRPAADGSGGDGSTATYILTATFKREEPSTPFDGLDVKITVPHNLTIVGTPEISDPQAIADSPSPDSAGWLLNIGDRTTIPVRIHLQLRSAGGPDGLQTPELDVRYRFRAFPPNLGDS
jgi:hypothetical protein